MNCIEQFTIGKSTTAASEDAVVVTSFYAAVIDGATPKTAYRYPSGETPGELAARLLSVAIAELPPNLDVAQATERLTAALHQEQCLPANRPIASVVIYSVSRREVWLIGDCQFGFQRADGSFGVVTNHKYIDHFLASWRRDIIRSYITRGLMTESEILAHDPGRRIIQPLITRQVYYQNRLAPMGQRGAFDYCMLDGEPIPEAYLRSYPIDPGIETLVLASDGYPELLPTLAECEARLEQLLTDDPLCIGPLLGTKGIRPGNRSYDDRSFLRMQI